MKILFQNANFVIVDKPALTLSVPGRFAEDDRPVVGKILQEQLGKKIFPTHRLDFEVSGILIFALTPQAHAVANSWFENKKISKVYQALTDGNAPEQNSFKWESKLLRGKKRAYESPIGKTAVTEAFYLGKREQHLLWDLKPITGRSHQLRYECAKYGFPILGDTLYGSKAQWNLGIALRAYKIFFPADASKWELPSQIEIPGEFID